MQKHDLAIFGGQKEITLPQPHWTWPPREEQEIRAITDYLRHGRNNARGYPEIVEEFERNFAAYHNLRHALTTNSGTSALHAAFFAVGIRPGDEVLAPTVTFHATASPLFQLRAVPVLCDCEPDTANIDPGEIKKRITSKTKAIVVTHMWGHPCEMDVIKGIAEEKALALVEDCSHAHGAEFKGQKVGTFGDIGCFSLDNKKMMASGEAGILITNKRELFERALLTSDFGPRLQYELTLPEFKEYFQTGLGMKYRINPLAAVIANEKLKTLVKYIGLRKEKLDYLSKGIEGLAGIAPPVTRPYVTRGACFGYKPLFKGDELNNLEIDVFIKILQAEGMDIRRTESPPIHLMPLFGQSDDQLLRNTGFPREYDRGIKGPVYKKGDFPASEHFHRTRLSLPTFTFEPYPLIDQYIRAFRKVCNYLSANGPITIGE